MPTLTLTAKRQVTLPAATCRELGLMPGDVLHLVSAVVDGRQVWVLEARRVRARAWSGSLARYGAKKSDHGMRAIRSSITKGRARER